MPRILLLLLLTLLAGCASDQTASVYQTGQVQQQMRVVMATVVSVRDVVIQDKPNGTGAGAGAAIGAVAGSGGGYGKGAVIGAVAGAVVGGVAGNLVQKALDRKDGIEIIYRPDGGTQTFALVQQKDPANVINAGDRIQILEGQYSARAIKVSG